MLDPQSTVFISDIHLSAQDSALQNLFIDFLQGPASFAESIYILGDLFDVWVGKDIQPEFHDKISEIFSQLTAKGISLYFMVGNRDFLIQSSFLKKANLKKLNDPTLITLHGVPTILTHGDKLCTQDIAYQRYRLVAQNPITRFLFLSLPKSLRERIARKLRLKSKLHQQKQNMTILDVVQNAVNDMMNRYGVTQMIHGHVHRPNIHSFELGKKAAKRLVLGDWHNMVSFIISTPTENCLATYEPSKGIQKIASYALECAR